MLLSELRPYIRIRAAGAPDPLIDMSLVDAAREFCKLTDVWRYELESSDLGKEGQLVTLSPPEDTVILRVFSVEYGDVGTLTPATKAQLSRNSATWRDAEGDPTHYSFKAPDSLFLYPWPTTLSTRDVTVTVSLMPAVGVTEISDDIATQYSRVIQDGALAQLLSIPKKSWSDNDLAAAYGTSFGLALADVKEQGTDYRMPNLPRKVRYGGY